MLLPELFRSRKPLEDRMKKTPCEMTQADALYEQARDRDDRVPEQIRERNKAPDFSPRLELMEDHDADGSPLVAQQIANALPGTWYAYRFPHNDPRNHFLLHCPFWIGSELYACGSDLSWEWSVGAMFTPEAHAIPGLVSGRPICRTHINTAKTRTPAAIAKDLERRLLPDARAHWLKTTEYVEEEAAEWHKYLETLERVADMIGAPRPALPRAGGYGADRYSLMADNWEVEITRYGLGYEIKRTGSTDLFDMLERIGWGEDEG